MTAPARPRTRTARHASPEQELRARALRYGRDDRVVVRQSGCDRLNGPVTYVRAIILPADRGQWGFSVPVSVSLDDGRWQCDEHPGENACAHRLAVQKVTGYGHLKGRWAA